MMTIARCSLCYLNFMSVPFSDAPQMIEISRTVNWKNEKSSKITAKWGRSDSNCLKFESIDHHTVHKKQVKQRSIITQDGCQMPDPSRQFLPFQFIKAVGRKFVLYCIESFFVKESLNSLSWVTTDAAEKASWGLANICFEKIGKTIR